MDIRRVKVEIEEEQLNDAYFVMMAIRAVSDMMCNMDLQTGMNMVKPENMEALMTILADRLEKAVTI